MADAVTRPAPADETVELPPTSSVTPLALAALQLGVEPDDVLEYLKGARSYRKSSERLAAVRL